MLKTRLISAGLMIFLVVFVLSLSPAEWFYPLYVGFAFAVMLIAATEFIALRWEAEEHPHILEFPHPTFKFKHFCVGFVYAFPMLLYAICYRAPDVSYLHQKMFLLLLTWVFLSVLVIVICVYKNAKNLQVASQKLINLLAGFIYLALPGILTVKLVEFPELIRSSYVYFVLAVIHMGDAGAYFVGMKFGKHKLIPKISPKKSIEGACGGLIFSALTALFIKYILSLPLGAGICILAGILLGLAGQLGDLVESAFKRAAGFKDSGHLLPGHGGVLDRIDSLCLGIPVAFILLSFVL